MRRVPRFKCGTCKGGFSRQSFATSYYLKRPELLAPVASMLNSGSAHRQIARHLDCAPSTVTRLSVHLGRHATLVQGESLACLEQIEEPVVLDHFETFVRSQQERLGIGTAVGKDSWFVYLVDSVRYLGTTRRSWRKRPLKQKPKAALLGAVVDSTRKILEMLQVKCPKGLDLISDEHPIYRAMVRQINSAVSPSKQIRHETYANPHRSDDNYRQLAKKRNREMFAADLLHKLIRHCLAHHRRETIAFGRKTANVHGRMMLFAVWRNFIKRETERRPTRFTPAMRVGLTDKIWTWKDLLAQRIFPGRIAKQAA